MDKVPWNPVIYREFVSLAYLSKEEEKILADAEDAEKIEEVKKDNFIVNFFNSPIKSMRDKIQKE